MRVIEGLDALAAPFEATTVAIGNFDGVHRGHAALMTAAVRDAREHQRPAVAFTFDRHPEEVVAPERAPEYLTTAAQRDQLIGETAMDILVVARFDRPFSRLDPAQFVANILCRRLGARCIVAGRDFRFGRDRSGDVPYLLAARERFGFDVRIIEPVMVDSAPVSSTSIRQALLLGRFREAENMLGHAYLLAGTVVPGMRLGKRLGFPTANLALATRQVVPPDGIYAVRAHLGDGSRFGGACSIGSRPTVEGAGHAIEVYLLDFEGDIYGAGIEVQFVSLLRPEQRFDSLDALREQMARDAEHARVALTAETAMNF